MVTMRTVVGLLFLLTSIVAFGLYKQLEVNKQQAISIKKLSDIVNKQNSEVSLELQGKCAKQAGETFKELGYKNGGTDFYESHYNKKLNVCFLSISSLYKSTVSESLVDAYEQRVYATYMWIADKNKKYSEVVPMLCRVMPNTKYETKCSSEEEYKSYVAKLME